MTARIIDGKALAADLRATIASEVVFEEALAVAGAITPVPSGAGPMIIACLL